MTLMDHDVVISVGDRDNDISLRIGNVVHNNKVMMPYYETLIFYYEHTQNKIHWEIHRVIPSKCQKELNK